MKMYFSGVSSTAEAEMLREAGVDVKLTVVMSPDLVGSTCTKEKVGEVVETVYRVMCGGAA